jgi:hypothetical protein
MSSFDRPSHPMTTEEPERRLGESEVIAVGNTIRRPAHPRSAFVQDLLAQLADAGFTGAPRPLGFDHQGREVVSFVGGIVPLQPPFLLTDAELLSATLLIKDYHDATARLRLRGSDEIVCHGDLGPHNTVFRGHTAVALIDWDEGVRPGRRAVDFAHAVWCFADLCEDEVPLPEQARRARVMCSAYPTMTVAEVVEELVARFQRARLEHADAHRSGAVEVFDRLLAWMNTNGPAIADSG